MTRNVPKNDANRVPEQPAPETDALSERVKMMAKNIGITNRSVRYDAAEVHGYSLFCDHFRPNNPVVYYPWSETDIAPSMAFPNSKVIYVDINARAIETLKEDGKEAYLASALKYNPWDVDILILRNVNSPILKATVPFLRKWWYVLCNDHGRTMSELLLDNNFKMMAAVSDSNELITGGNLDDYCTEVETDEEFKNVNGGHHYRMVKKLVMAVTWKEENILEELKKIVKNWQAYDDMSYSSGGHGCRCVNI